MTVIITDLMDTNWRSSPDMVNAYNQLYFGLMVTIQCLVTAFLINLVHAGKANDKQATSEQS